VHIAAAGIAVVAVDIVVVVVVGIAVVVAAGIAPPVPEEEVVALQQLLSYR